MEFSPDLNYKISGDGTISFTDGVAVLNDDFYRYNYMVNMFDGSNEDWNVIDRKGNPANDETSRAVWEDFYEYILPTVVLNVHSKSPTVPKKFLESIPGIKEEMGRFQLSDIPEDIGDVASNIDWQNVKDPGWHKETNRNWINGIFIVKNHSTGETNKYPFTFSEQVDYRTDKNTGELMRRQYGPKINWKPKPRVPKRLLQNYERMVMGDIGSKALKEKKEKDEKRQRETGQPAVAPEQKKAPLPPPPKKVQQPPTAPVQQEPPVTIGNKWKPTKVTFGDWRLSGDKVAVDGELEYIGMDKPFKFVMSEDEKGMFGVSHADPVNALPKDETKEKEWFDLIKKEFDKLPYPDKEAMQSASQTSTASFSPYVITGDTG